MYAVCLYQGYENNKWYTNGGSEVVDELMKPINKYRLKFFVNNLFLDSESFDDAVLQDEIPLVSFSYVALNQLNYELDSMSFSTEKNLVLWGALNSYDLKTFYKEVFGIKYCEECPFVMRRMDFSLCIIKRPDNIVFSNNEMQYLYDFSFDRIGDRYFLMPDLDVSRRRYYNNEPLTFNQPKILCNYKMVWTELIWTEMKLKYSR